MESNLGEITDEVILYQMEKVDQGGDVSDVFEERLLYLAEAWGFPIENDEESMHYGDMRLPDGRYAYFEFKAVIVEPYKPSLLRRVLRAIS